MAYHGRSPGAEIARSPAAWERIAKNWMLEVIERSPLDEVDTLPLGWISQQAAPLIAEILGLLSDPGAAHELRLSPAAIDRAAALARERDPQVLASRLPGELAALQSLLIEALDRELPERDRREFTRAVVRLAEVVGAVQTAALESVATPGPPPQAVVQESSVGATSDREAHEVLIESLAAESQRSGTPFAVVHFEVEGVERISKGYGDEAANRMVDAVAGILEGQLAGAEQAFRIGFGQLLAVVPGKEAADAVALATGVADVVEHSQAGRGPRVEVAAGLASFPLHASSPKELCEAAEVAAWDARAGGRGVAIASVHALQDP